MSLDTEENYITLKTPFNSWKIERKIVKMSGLLSNIDSSDSEVELNTPDWIMSKIVDFMTYHYDKPVKPVKKPIPTSDITRLLDNWDVNFIDNMETSKIIELANSADYYDIKDLIIVCLTSLACDYKSKKF